MKAKEIIESIKEANKKIKVGTPSKFFKQPSTEIKIKANTKLVNQFNSTMVDDGFAKGEDWDWATSDVVVIKDVHMNNNRVLRNLRIIGVMT